MLLSTSAAGSAALVLGGLPWQTTGRTAPGAWLYPPALSLLPCQCSHQMLSSQHWHGSLGQVLALLL